MSVIRKLRAEQDEAARKARELMGKAKAEERELTQEERAEIQGHLDEAKRCKAKIEGIQERDELEAEIERMAGQTSGTRDADLSRRAAARTEGGRVLGLGEQFTESEAYRRIAGLDRGSDGRPSRFSTGAITLRGEVVTTGNLSAGQLIAPDRRTDILPILFPQLTIADLLGAGRTDSNQIIVPTETVATNAAAAIAEGDLKPQSTIRFATVTESVKKIATSMKLSDESITDIPYLQTYIEGRMRLFVRQEEEDQILNGDGTGANLLGLRNRSGLTAAQARGTDSNFDAIFKQIRKIMLASFLMPDGIVLNPANWTAMALAKDSTGQYLGVGPFSAQAVPMRLWGLPVVETTSITAGSAFIGAFRAAAALIRRGDGVTVEMTNSNEDDFLRNLIALRAEERAALAVYRPAAFGAVTGLE